MSDQELRKTAEKIVTEEYQKALDEEISIQRMLAAARKGKREAMEHKTDNVIEMDFSAKRKPVRPAAMRVAAIAAVFALVVCGSLLAVNGTRLPYQSIVLSSLPQSGGIYRGDETDLPDEEELQAQFGWSAALDMAPLTLVSQEVYASATVSSDTPAQVLAARYEGGDAAAVLSISDGKLLLVEALADGKPTVIAGQQVWWNRDPENGQQSAAWRQDGRAYTFVSSGLKDGQLKDLVEKVINCAMH